MATEKQWILFARDMLSSDITEICYYMSEPFPRWSGSLECASVFTEEDAKHIASLLAGLHNIQIDIHPRFRYG